MDDFSTNEAIMEETIGPRWKLDNGKGYRAKFAGYDLVVSAPAINGYHTWKLRTPRGELPGIDGRLIDQDYLDGYQVRDFGTLNDFGQAKRTAAMTAAKRTYYDIGHMILADAEEFPDGFQDALAGLQYLFRMTDNPFKRMEAKLMLDHATEWAFLCNIADRYGQEPGGSIAGPF